MEFTIDRSKWVCGNFKNSGNSRLLNDKGRMCCLGFLAKECGQTDDEIRGAGTPSYLLKSARTPLMQALCTSVGTWNEFIHANDAPENDQRTREKQLKVLFKEKLNLTVKFNGKLGLRK